MLYQYLSVSGLIGIGVMCLVLPTNLLISKRLRKYNEALMKKRDHRVDFMNEVLQVSQWSGARLESHPHCSTPTAHAHRSSPTLRPLALQGIKALKLYTWEALLKQQVEKKRDDELSQL